MGMWLGRMRYCAGGRRGVWYRSLAVHDWMWGTAWAEWRDALAQAVQLVPQHVDFACHVLMALLEIDYKINGCKGGSAGSGRERRQDRPLLRISHLLAFMPRSAGS